MKRKGILKLHNAERLCDAVDLWGPQRAAFLMIATDGFTVEEVAEQLLVSQETAWALADGARNSILAHNWESQADRDLIECLRNRKRCDPTAAVVELRSPVVGVDDLRADQDTLPEMLGRMKGGEATRRRRGDDLRPQRTYDVACGRPGRNYRFKQTSQEVRAGCERDAAIRAAALYGWETVMVRRSGPEGGRWSCYDAQGREMESKR